MLVRQSDLHDHLVDNVKSEFSNTGAAKLLDDPITGSSVDQRSGVRIGRELTVHPARSRVESWEGDDVWNHESLWTMTPAAGQPFYVHWRGCESGASNDGLIWGAAHNFFPPLPLRLLFRAYDIGALPLGHD